MKKSDKYTPGPRERLIFFYPVTWASHILDHSEFNSSIYDEHISLHKIALLPWEPDPLSVKLRAFEVMSCPAVALDPVMNVGDLVKVVRCHPHHAFPLVQGVCDPARFVYGHLVGMISSQHLALILKKRAFLPLGDEQAYQLTIEDYDNAYPRCEKLWLNFYLFRCQSTVDEPSSSSDRVIKPKGLQVWGRPHLRLRHRWLAAYTSVDDRLFSDARYYNGVGGGGGDADYCYCEYHCNITRTTSVTPTTVASRCFIVIKKDEEKGTAMLHRWCDTLGIKQNCPEFVDRIKQANFEEAVQK
ncbi:unnamed protein product [Dibothriocephalus latus]|uniref:Uncharacterized protein n=1 Tax=Dibothriocephalus latus TaxID=60516 RepID=A0A3P7LMW1_DIBLA|nr:unnamed protein product [Dibothriocephalus latus]